MKKLLFLSLAAMLGMAAAALAGPVTLYRIELAKDCNAYRFAAEHAVPVFYAGQSTLLCGQPLDSKQYPQIAAVAQIFAGDAGELLWVHVRRGAAPADLGLPVLFSDNGAMLMRAPQAKGIDPARFMPSSFNARPVVLPPRVLAVNSALTPDTAITRIVQEITIAGFQATDSALQAFNTRSTIAPNHNEVANWIRDKFLSFGIADVRIDSSVNPGFTSYVRQYYGVTDSAKIRNVIATIPGLVDTHTVYVVGGHYDSSVWPYNPWAPGADDNGSGTTAALEMARVMAGNRPNCTVKFVAFDCEEWGLYGCDKFAADALASGTHIGCMLNFDMIANLGNDSLFNCYAYDGSEPLAQLSGQSAQWYGRTADTNLVPVYVDQNSNGSDSWSFFTRGYPVTYSEEYLFSPNWHQTTDSTTNMNMRYGTSIVRAGLGLLATLANYPQSVAGLQAIDLGDGSSLLVRWDPSTSPGTAGYKILWGRASGGYSDSLIVTTPADTIHGLMNDSLYHIGVAIIDGLGRQSLFLAETSGTPHAVPVAPTGAVAAPVAAGVRVDWKKNAELDIAGYALYRRINAGAYDSLAYTTDSTYTDQPLSGVNKYYYKIKAVDADGNGSPLSDSAYGRPFTLDQGVLIVDETYNWSSGSYPRDTTQDRLYNYMFWDYKHTQYEFGNTALRPSLSDLAPYSTVWWMADDQNSYFWASGSAADLKQYLDAGGNVAFSGWEPVGNLAVTTTYPIIKAAGSMLYDYFKVSQAGLSGAQDSVIGATGQNGFADVTVDSARVPITSWKGTMRYDEALTLTGAGVPIYGINLRNSGSGNQGQTCGVEYLGPAYKTALLGFPLIFMKQDQARALVTKIMTDFGEEYVGVAGGQPAVTAPVFGLMSNRPNPFKQATTIKYQLAKAGPAELSVYNITGQKVKTLVNGQGTAGAHAISWDGRDQAGRALSGGVYFMRLSADGNTQTRKITIIR